MTKLHYAGRERRDESARFARWLIGASLLGPAVLIGHAAVVLARGVLTGDGLPGPDPPRVDSADGLLNLFRVGMLGMLGMLGMFVSPPVWLAALACCVSVRPRHRAAAYALLATAGQALGWAWLILDPLGVGAAYLD